LLYKEPTHIKHSFIDETFPNKTKFMGTVYYAKQFEALRRLYCDSEMDFIQSLSRCKKWITKGGKSGAPFSKTLDDRFVLKSVSKIELQSFLEFAPAYFEYMSKSFFHQLPTVLVKIFGVYKVGFTNGTKSIKQDVVVMENLFYNKNVTRIFDLKGSTRSRYVHSTNKDDVFMDENMLEYIFTNPLYVNEQSKIILKMSIWNDTLFLYKRNVMDYSFLLGVDETNHELVVGIIDFFREYTWDKHLETWVKSAAIIGQKGIPTVISPKQYKNRFRAAMERYFVMVPNKFTFTQYFIQNKHPAAILHNKI